MLSAREARQILIAALVRERGLASETDAAEALRRYWDGRAATGASFGAELGRISPIAPEALRAAEGAADELIREAEGDGGAALLRRGGIPHALMSALAGAGSLLPRDLARAGRTVPPDLRAMPAKRYGEFEVVGEGGMGVVYMALDTELSRFVALKMIRPDAADGPPGPPPATPMGAERPAADTPASRAFEELKRRFLTEATVTAGLEHPGIVPVYELGETPQGVPYYTMRFVRGQKTLRQAIEEAQQGAFERRLALLEPFLRLCDTVAYAHSRGVLHRDLKPENIALGEFGEVVVLDWGLAKLHAEEDPSASLWRGRALAMGSATALQSGQGALGTPGYMSPEAAAGRLGAVDVRTDVYSLGVILFEILTGQLPHAVEVTAESRIRVVPRPGVTLRSLAPEAPPPLEEICTEAVALDRESRLADVRALAAGIRAWQAASARDREIEGLRRDARAVLEAARGLTGGDRVRQVDRAAAVLHQIEARAGPLPAEDILGHEVATLRDQGMREHARISSRRVLGRVGALVLALVALGAVAFAGALEQRRRAEALLVAQAQREQGRQLLLDGRPLQALALLDPAYHAMPADRVTRFLVARAEEMLQVTSRSHVQHESDVMGVAALAGGRVAFSTWSGALLLWDPDLGGAPTAVVAKGPRILGMVATPSRGLLLAVRERATALLVDAQTGKILAELPADGVHHVRAFDPSGERLVVAGKEDEIVVWDVARTEPVWRSPPQGSPLTAAAISGDHLVAATADGRAHLWNWREGRSVRSWQADLAEIGQIAFARGGERFLLAGYQARVAICRTADGTVAGSIDRHHSSVIGAEYDPTGTRIASGSWDGTVVVAEADSGRSLLQLEADGSIVTSVRLSPTGERVAAGYGDGMVRVWHTGSGQLLTTLVGHADQINGLDFLGGDERLVSASSDRTVRVWDLPARTPWGGPLEDGSTTVSYAGFLPSGGLVLTLEDGRIVECARSGGEPLWEVRRPGPAMDRAAVSRDGRLLAAGFENGAVEIWDLGRRASHRVLDEGWPPVRDLEFSSDGNALFTTHGDGSARVTDVTSGVARILGMRQGATGSVSVGGTGRLLALTGWNRAALLISLESQEGTLIGDIADVATRAALSPDERVVAVGYWNDDVRLWDAAEGHEVGTLPGDRRPLSALAWGADGRLLAGWSGDHAAPVTRVWDGATTGLLLELQNVRFAPGPEAFSRDGSTLALIPRRGPPVLVSLTETRRTPDEVAAWVRAHVPYVARGTRVVRRASAGPHPGS